MAVGVSSMTVAEMFAAMGGSFTGVTLIETVAGAPKPLPS
jgi:hypothetical protein